MKSGQYALSVTTTGGYQNIEVQNVPDTGVRIQLSPVCHLLSVRVDGHVAEKHVSARRRGGKGSKFAAIVDGNGATQMCLPEGQYEVAMLEPALSTRASVDVSGPASVRLRGFHAEEVMRSPSPVRIDASLSSLVDDVVAAKSKIVGLGESTHGTAEFFSVRGAATFELIKHAGVQLLLFEFDAVAGAQLDDYVNGGNVDLANAVAALGYWTTDTYEFWAFLKQLRDYNASAVDKVHIWGVDLQDTTPPVNVLLANARELAINDAEQAIVRRMDKRAKAVLELTSVERSMLDAMLARLSVPQGATWHHLLNAVAARSLHIQLGYWIGDMSTWYRKRRDRGMAELSQFIVDQLKVQRAVLWAHDAHVTKDPDEAMLGYHLSQLNGGYYAIGFYLYEGTARAWDEESKIGVIPHPISPAPTYTVESVLMKAAAMPVVAWVPLRKLPASLTKWLEVPRYVREIYATFRGNEAALILRDERISFDAIVVV